MSVSCLSVSCHRFLNFRSLAAIVFEKEVSSPGPDV